jgi:hypothetical protein
MKNLLALLFIFSVNTVFASSEGNVLSKCYATIEIETDSSMNTEYLDEVHERFLKKSSTNLLKGSITSFSVDYLKYEFTFEFVNILSFNKNRNDISVLDEYIGYSFKEDVEITVTMLRTVVLKLAKPDSNVSDNFVPSIKYLGCTEPQLLKMP